MALGKVAVGTPQRPDVHRAHPKNMLFMAIDTLRSDALSCYGNRWKTSPNIDKLASTGATLDNFYSVGNCTHPGFTSMITGMFPERTGIVSHWTRVELDESVKTMAQYMKEAGFHTTAVDNLYDGWRPKHPFYPWFRRGYDFYAYPPGQGHYRRGLDVSNMASAWLRKQASEPFFLFVHYWDPHAPYNKAPKKFYRFYRGSDPCDPRLDYMPPNVRDKQRRIFGRPITDPKYVTAAYLAETAYVDYSVGRLLRVLEELSLHEETLVALTSDHGEILDRPTLAVGRPFSFCHIGLTEECLRIPLIVSGPGVPQGVRISKRFQLIDLLPTLLDLVGIHYQDLDGESFAPALRGSDTGGRDNLFFSENTYQKQRAVLSWPWKYMRMEDNYDSMPRKSLFNLESDPLETINLADTERETADRLDRVIDAYVRETTRGHGDPIKEQEITGTI